MTIYDISGLEVGNDEELQRVFDNVYARRKTIQVLEVNKRQMTFIADCYDVYGEAVPTDSGKPRQAIFFESPMGAVELRVVGEDR